MVITISLPRMNSFNKSRLLFSHAGYASWGLSLSSLNNCLTENTAPGSGPSISPDDDIFRHLALTYSRSHHTMAATNGTECGRDYFHDGITNGADWYPIAGTACILFPKGSAERKEVRGSRKCTVKSTDTRKHFFLFTSASVISIFQFRSAGNQTTDPLMLLTFYHFTFQLTIG